MSKLAHEVLELGSVESSVRVGVSGLEGLGHLCHSLALGLLITERSSVSLDCGLLGVGKSCHPGHSLLYKGSDVHGVSLDSEINIIN